VPIHITSKWFHGILSKVETYFPPDTFKIIKVTIDANFASLKNQFHLPQFNLPSNALSTFNNQYVLYYMIVL